MLEPCRAVGEGEGEVADRDGRGGRMRRHARRDRGVFAGGI